MAGKYNWRKHVPNAKRREKKRLLSGNNYQSRMYALVTLGFKSYQEYLDSDLWKSIRSKVFKVKGDACYYCGLPATEIHHNRYHVRDLTGRKLKYLDPICRSCHKEIEFTEGNKNNVLQARKAGRKKKKALVKVAKEVLGEVF